MSFMRPTFYKNKIKNVYDNAVCPGKLWWCCFVNGNVYFSQYIPNKVYIHTLVPFCCLTCPLATTKLFLSDSLRECVY